jgi:hypothetical protein
MNFKTTVVLLGLLVVAFGALWFTREQGGGEGGTGTVAEDRKQKLFDVAAGDVNKLVIASADGKRMLVEKSGAKWRMTEPVTAPAEAFEVDSLIRAITELESRGKVSADSASAEATGLAKPRYVVDLSTTAGKTYTLNVGEKPAVGDIVYVSRKDQGDTLVVAGDLLEKLDKPASDFRDKKMVDVVTGDVRQITIEKPDGKIVIARKGTGDWNITEPKAMPAEKSEIDDIVFGITGLRAVEYVSENATADAATFGLDKPRLRVTVSSTQPAVHPFVTSAPTTAAATTQNAPLVVNLGRFDDVLKKNVYASTSQSPVIAKVSATIIETINKKPIELRDKRVLNVDPAQVSSITIASDLQATTKPASRPASKKEVVIKRRKDAAKPHATTAPATTQASTQSATTQPGTTQAATQPATTWEVVSGPVYNAADDSKVDSLLTQLHPLRAQKYLENPPATQPTASYVVRITTVAAGGAEATHELRLVDPGGTQPLRGTYNDLAFEADRFLVDRLSGDFLKGSAPATPPGTGGAPGHDSDAAPFPVGP